MHCLEAEGCVVCRGRNLVVDFSKVESLVNVLSFNYVEQQNCDVGRLVRVLAIIRLIKATTAILTTAKVNE